MNYPPSTPIQNIKRIQPAYQKRLLKLGIKTFQDLFYYFPRRYDDFSKITPISQLKLNEVATVQGKIIEIKNSRTWRKKILITEAYIEDETGIIKTVWFNQPYLVNTLKKDSQVSLSGKINFDETLYLSNPAYEKITRRSPTPFVKGAGLRHTGRLVPVYPETAGLSSRYLRFLIQIFSPSIPQFKDWLPQEIKIAQRLPDLNTALKQIHFPGSQKYLEAAKHRLAFDELFLIQVFALQQKIKWQNKQSLKIPFNESLIKNFVARLPFKLTNAQRKAAWEILQDLNKTRPMNRLLEGDVGSGKTVVAAIAALQTISTGWQAALMAPTEILARQHFQTISELFAKSDLKISLLTSGDSKASCRLKITDYQKKKLLEKIKTGEINIVIGTHALIQKEVGFKNLALVIVDEQHRFGVEQRAALQKKVLRLEDGSPATVPHLLSLTATPIPRTLALTIYGDLDISLLDEIPKGRQEIITRIVAPASRQKAYEFISQQVKAGRQVFVICPRIEPSDKCLVISDQGPRLLTNHLSLITSRSWDDVKAVKEEYEKLSKKFFPDLKIAMLHGQLKSKEKEKIMLDFKNSQTDILVSTSVVEVGIDVPNATVMIIEGAERFGLAQLHQFRGRVGRGPHQSYCLLFTDSNSRQTHARLKALLTCKNGFELAEKDLAIRGPGEFFGTRQWGLPDLSMASLTDMELIKQVRLEAVRVLQKDPALKKYPLLCEKLDSFQRTIHLE